MKIKKRQPKTRKLGKGKLILNDEDDKDDGISLVYCKLFSSNYYKVKWVQCIKCKNCRTKNALNTKD